MNRIEILAIVTPIFVTASVIAMVWIANHFQDKQAEAERQARARNDHPARSASAAE